MAATTSAPEFVSFHADRPAGEEGAHPNANLQSQVYMGMLDLLFRSARLFHPAAACTVLTSANTRVRGVRGPVRRVDGPVDHRALMLSRSLAQLAWVRRSDFSRPMVLLDSDILLRGSLQPLFDEDFDVGLTWRVDKTMPVNGGLLILHNRRPDVSRAFFERFVRVYRERYASADNAGWYGDQYALRDLVGLSHREMRDQTLVERDGCRIRLLPCDVYNYSPDNSLAAIVGGLPDKVVLHFKGQRKRLMAPFWQCFLAPRASWWPWARRRARDHRERLLADAAAEAKAPVAAGPVESDA